MNSSHVCWLKISACFTFAMLVLGAGCAATKSPSLTPAPAASPVLLSAPKTVVVADFQNQSLLPPEKTQFWSGALASLLIADLQESEHLRVLDRQHLADILQEERLSNSDLADASTRLQVGRRLGANYMIFGSYIILGDTTILDVRMDNVETGEVAQGANLKGDTAAMRTLSRQLAVNFLKGLDEKMAKIEEADIAQLGGPPPEAIRYFSEGLDLEHRGLYQQAVERYTQALTVYPQYSEAKKHLEKSSEKAVR